MTTTRHPVDSTYHPCCSAIGQHTQSCDARYRTAALGHSLEQAARCAAELRDNLSDAAELAGDGYIGGRIQLLLDLAKSLRVGLGGVE